MAKFYAYSVSANVGPNCKACYPYFTLQFYLLLKVQYYNKKVTWLTSGISRAHSSPPSLQLICKAIFWVTLLNLFCCDMVLAFITYNDDNRWQYTAAIKCTLPSRKRAHYGISTHPHFGLNFLVNSNVHSNIRPCSCLWKMQLKWLIYEDWTSKSLC